MSKTRCEYFDDDGVRCACRTESDLCVEHTKVISKRKKPRHTCPACLESKRTMTWFGCNHGLCSTCLPSMCSFSCPVCRADFSRSVGREIRKVIKATIEKEEEKKIASQLQRDAELARQHQEQLRRAAMHGNLGDAMQIFFSPSQVDVGAIITLLMGSRAFAQGGETIVLHNHHH